MSQPTKTKKRPILPVGMKSPQSKCDIQIGDHVIYIGIGYLGTEKAFNAVVTAVNGRKINLVYINDNPVVNDEFGRRIVRATNVNPGAPGVAEFYSKP